MKQFNSQGINAMQEIKVWDLVWKPAPEGYFYMQLPHGIVLTDSEEKNMCFIPGLKVSEKEDGNEG